MKCLFLLPFILLFSCIKHSKTSESTNTDSISRTNRVSTDDSPKTAATTFHHFPVIITDSTYKDTIKLDASFLNSRVLPFEKDVDGGWEIYTFLLIDSLKASKSYNDYVSSLDIGQTKDAVAYIYDTINIKSAQVVLWGISHSSYDACPYYSGRSIFVTSFSAGKPGNTQRLLDNSGGGDSPYYGYTKGDCFIEETGIILCKDSIVSGGEYQTVKGKEYEEIITKTAKRKYQIQDDGKIKIIEAEMSPEKKTLKAVQSY